MAFRRLAIDAVNRAAATAAGAAGKGVNVAKVLKILGADPVAIGFLGGPHGERIRDALHTAGIEVDFVDSGVPTRECVTLLDQETETTTELVEESRPVARTCYDKLTDCFHKHLGASAAVVMSGTITPGGPSDFYLKCVQSANAAGKLSVLDAQGSPLLTALTGSPGVVKPNRVELASTVSRELACSRDVLVAMQELHARGAQRVVVTAGKDKTLAFDGERAWEVITPTIQAVNPIGSGDAFTAGVVWRLLKGDDLGEACRWGAACGAANALTLMAGDVRRDDVERLLAFAEVRSVAL
jgi:tagatose 6-phosphate kinase